jgi:hypothetical protein
MEALLNAESVGFIDEAVWGRIAEALAPVSQNYLRRLVRSTGLAMSPLVEGVCQKSFADVERTLSALQREYELGGPERRRRIRAEVISAKDHTRWALQKTGLGADAKAVKEEMLLWILTWLENPGLFSAWLAIRKRLATEFLSSQH